MVVDLAKVGVSVIGGSGYTGAELLRILVRHTRAKILHVTSRELSGTPVSQRLPNLNWLDLEYEMPVPKQLSDSDVVFVCTPHTSSMEIVPEVLEHCRVVDISADYRLADRKLYEAIYQVKHTSPQLKSVYGLPELHRDEIASADLVANPGCFPTGAVLALAPLVRKALIEEDRIVIDAKSGSSGAGVKPTAFTSHAECANAVKPYNVTGHRHIAEIDQELSLVAGKDLRVNFTPHLVPIPRGIVTTCHTFPTSQVTEGKIRSLYTSFYEGCPFVRIRPEVPDLRGVLGSNFCDIGFSVDARTGRLVVVSAIDNLMKGASGQAVQNMNIMFKLPETQGLDLLGLYP